jgi:hypothetical protein
MQAGVPLRLKPSASCAAAQRRDAATEHTFCARFFVTRQKALFAPSFACQPDSAVR